LGAACLFELGLYITIYRAHLHQPIQLIYGTLPCKHQKLVIVLVDICIKLLATS